MHIQVVSTFKGICVRCVKLLLLLMKIEELKDTTDAPNSTILLTAVEKNTLLVIFSERSAPIPLSSRTQEPLLSFHFSKEEREGKGDEKSGWNEETGFDRKEENFKQRNVRWNPLFIILSSRCVYVLGWIWGCVLTGMGTQRWEAEREREQVTTTPSKSLDLRDKGLFLLLGFSDSMFLLDHLKKYASFLEKGQFKKIKNKKSDSLYSVCSKQDRIQITFLVNGYKILISINLVFFFFFLAVMAQVSSDFYFLFFF